MQTYNRLPVGFERGQGAWLWDGDGRRYLDAIAGVAVAVLGHAHPEVAEAVADQAATLVHTSNLFRIPLQEHLGERLCALADMDRAFFGNSGAEANEAAIKIARRYGHNRGIAEPAILVTEGAFHGRTMATLTATGNRKVQAGFEPLVAGFKRVPYDDLTAIEQVGQHDRDVVAVLVEPIQGEGGIVIPSEGYLRGLREICDRFGWLLMLDEIQTGMCRTGTWFAFQQEAIRPDVFTLAKALGNGVPIGACLARGEASEVLVPGTHGSTFGGNPLACRAALTVLNVLEREDLAARAADLGQLIMNELDERLGGNADVRAIRGRGLMMAVEMARPCGELARVCLDEGLLINVTAGTVVRLLPPLVLTDSEADQLVTRLVTAIERFGGRG